ncbi:MAG TPA: PilZ domain-containing protein [Lachnospiraceae bacterium]|nr:PilZ domain-containing protein [Lachnospiraceae bacterium]
MLLKSCDACMIYGPEEGSRIPGRVVSVEDKITLFFDENTISDLVVNRVRIDFYDRIVGYIKTFCELVIRRNTDPWTLEIWAADCQILEVLETQQRQKDLRVKLEEELVFSAPYQKKEFHGFIENISVGGIFLVTNEIRLSRDEAFTFKYCFSKREQSLTAVTLREQQLRKERFGYGCQFTNMTNSAERDIRQFVYKKQLRQAR